MTATATDSLSLSTTSAAMRERSVRVYCTPQQDAKAEALAELVFDASKSETGRRLIEDCYARVFGDLDPTALLEGAVGTDTIDQLVTGSLSAADLSGDVPRIGTDVDAASEPPTAPASPPTPGGATDDAPTRHDTISPADLGRVGRQLSWEELKAAVADDRYWSDALEIHPDRVGETTLKRRKKPATRVIVAMARSIAENGHIDHDTLDDLIVDHLLHTHQRADDREARRYLIDTYRPLVTDHLYQDPEGEGYLTTYSECNDTVTETLGTALDRVSVEMETLLDVRAWEREHVPEDMDDNAKRMWYQSVGDWLEHVAKLHRTATTHAEIVLGLGMDYPDEYDNQLKYLCRLAMSLFEAYHQAVSARARQRIEATVDDVFDATLDDLAVDLEA
jgi:hypothetical protein